MSVAEFRDTLGYGSTDQDAVFTHLLVAAREWCEQHTWRQFITATYRLTLPHFTTELRPPRPPLVSVSSIQYYDDRNTLQTLSTDRYRVQSGSPGTIETAGDETWPSTYTRRDAVQVTFVAGYGSTEHSLPESIRVAIQYLAKHWYGCSEKTAGGQPMVVESLLAPFRCLDEFSLAGV